MFSFCFHLFPKGSFFQSIVYIVIKVVTILRTKTGSVPLPCWMICSSPNPLYIVAEKCKIRDDFQTSTRMQNKAVRARCFIIKQLVLFPWVLFTYFLQEIKQTNFLKLTKCHYIFLCQILRSFIYRAFKVENILLYCLFHFPSYTNYLYCIFKKFLCYMCIWLWNYSQFKWFKNNKIYIKSLLKVIFIYNDQYYFHPNPFAQLSKKSLGMKLFIYYAQMNESQRF